MVFFLNFANKIAYTKKRVYKLVYKSRYFIRRKIIVLYNSNDRETKRLDKKQLKEIERAENSEEIKENSSEPREFKRALLGAEKRI